jgi:hypothetical protein
MQPASSQSAMGDVNPPLHQAVEEEEQEPLDKEKYLLLKQLYAFTMPYKPG